jgi:hypothetical protein
VAVVQYTFTHEQYTEQYKKIHRTTQKYTIHGTTQKHIEQQKNNSTYNNTKILRPTKNKQYIEQHKNT